MKAAVLFVLVVVGLGVKVDVAKRTLSCKRLTSLFQFKCLKKGYATTIKGWEKCTAEEKTLPPRIRTKCAIVEEQVSKCRPFCRNQPADLSVTEATEPPKTTSEPPKTCTKPQLETCKKYNRIFPGAMLPGGAYKLLPTLPACVKFCQGLKQCRAIVFFSKYSSPRCYLKSDAYMPVSPIPKKFGPINPSSIEMSCLEAECLEDFVPKAKSSEPPKTCTKPQLETCKKYNRIFPGAMLPGGAYKLLPTLPACVKFCQGLKQCRAIVFFSKYSSPRCYLKSDAYMPVSPIPKKFGPINPSSIEMSCLEAECLEDFVPKA